ncbi:hypothetical protein B4110_0823 [Parageobacillus toebii]|uniref:Uncharacterized protein n=1 Tax=Parageobacillus toebii TaxID=153151 RepID=A0A150MUE2_9BACL|nr:hypothetical protein B4110_0823 [Parageobacillus toebii]
MESAFLNWKVHVPTLYRSVLDILILLAENGLHAEKDYHQIQEK